MKLSILKMSTLDLAYSKNEYALSVEYNTANQIGIISINHLSDILGIPLKNMKLDLNKFCIATDYFIIGDLLIMAEVLKYLNNKYGIILALMEDV